MERMENQLPMYMKLKRYIEENGISRKVLAKEVGRSSSQISLLLSGKRKLTVEEYERICRAMALPPQRFFGARP